MSHPVRNTTQDSGVPILAHSPIDDNGGITHQEISQNSKPDGSGLRRREVFTFWFLFLLSISFGAAVSYGVLGPIYLVPTFESSLPAGYGSGIYLQGVVSTLAIDSGAMGIQWLIYGCQESGPYAGCNALTEATNFYVDANASASNTFTEDNAALVFNANLTGYVTDGLCIDETSCWQQQLRDGVPYEQTLDTTHSFSIRPAAYNWRSNTQAYPFDLYTVSTAFIAIDPATGLSRKILGVSMTGTVPNFSVYMRSRAVSNPTYPGLEWRSVTVKIARAQIVIGYAFLIWAINWLMTGVVIWITIAAVQSRRRIPDGLFSVPITALFALPAVRNIMPGAPFFGCILDYGGIILNLAVLTICSIALLLTVIARDGNKSFYTPVPQRIRLPNERRFSYFIPSFPIPLRAGSRRPTAEADNPGGHGALGLTPTEELKV